MSRRSCRRCSFLTGTVLRRLVGEEKGAVMMEYVIVAVLIAAACVVAVVVFSRSVGGGFVTAARGAAGDHTQAQEKLHQQQSDRSEDAEQARAYSDSLHK